MKFTRLTWVCALCASPILLHAQTLDGIQILSQSYNISAAWSVNWIWDPSQPGNPQPTQPYPLGDWSAGYSSYAMAGGYNLSSSGGSPVTASTSAVSPLSGSPLSASASIGLFSVQNNAEAAPEGYPFPAPVGGTAAYYGRIQTSVQADWFFSPAGNLLDVSINALLDDVYGPTFGSFTITLSDTTDSVTLLDITPPQGALLPYSGGGDYVFAVNPADIYEFNVSGWSATYDSDFTSQSITASITSTPEPGACLIFSLGLAGFLGLRCKFGRR